MSNSEKTQITISTTVNAPIDRVWAAYNDPGHVMQWNHASDDWHSPRAKSDLRVGGKFNFYMASIDGKDGFDFEGEYTEVVDNKRVAYVMPDSRRVWVDFDDKGNSVDVKVVFEAENMYPHEMQRQGWQAILDNFKNHAEAKHDRVRLQFEIEIDAPAEKVVKCMTEKNYKDWTFAFNESSDYRGSWEEGSDIRFVGIGEDGLEGGMISRIKRNIANRYISIEHLGIMNNGVDITSGPEIEGWAGAEENYTFIEKDGKTTVLINVDTIEEYKDYFQGTWPEALSKLKSICEA